MIPFLNGALSAASLVAGLFFLRFWRSSGERLFIFFALAFWLFALHWGVLGIVNPPSETRHYTYLLRLLAFLMIVFGIVDHNRLRR
jgi:hypothetical protein